MQRGINAIIGILPGLTANSVEYFKRFSFAAELLFRC